MSLKSTPLSCRDAVKAALPGSPRTIMEATQLSRTTVWKWLTDLHDKRETHVIDWEPTPNGGPCIPVYAAGQGKDAKCKLKPMTDNQRSARKRAKARKDGRWEDYKATLRGRAAADRASFAKDPLLSAFFKPAAQR